jgi:hypothetical protein
VDRLGIEVDPLPWRFGSTAAGEALPAGGGAYTRLSVNDEPLVQMVRRWELQLVGPAGETHLAGAYRPLWGYGFERGLFFGRPASENLDYGDRVALMGCVCGDVGCWPFLASIEVTEDEIAWTAFRQPHRRRWNYARLPRLLFERSQYEFAVDNARERFRELVADSDDQRRAYEQRARVMRTTYPTEIWPDWPTASAARG